MTSYTETPTGKQVEKAIKFQEKQLKYQEEQVCVTHAERQIMHRHNAQQIRTTLTILRLYLITEGE